MPDINFRVEAGNTFRLMDQLQQAFTTGARTVQEWTVNFTRWNEYSHSFDTSISALIDGNRKLTGVLRSSADGLEFVNLKLEQNRKAMAAAATAARKADQQAAAALAREALEKTYSKTGLSNEQLAAQQSRISRIVNLLDRGRAEIEHFEQAMLAATGKLAVESLQEPARRIYDLLHLVENAQAKITDSAAKSLAKQKSTAISASQRLADAKSARQALEGAFPISGLTNEQLDTFRSRVSQVAREIERGNVLMGQFQRAQSAAAGKLGLSELDETEHNVYNILKRIDTAQLKTTEKAKQALALQKQIELASSSKLSSAKNVRGVLEGAYSTSGLSTTQVEQLRSRISQIVNLVHDGKAELNDFQQAALAVAGKISADSLDKTARGIFEVLKRIDNAQANATTKAQQSLAKQREKALEGDRRLSNAKTVRQSLESSFSTSGLTREQVDSQRARITQIVSLIEKGRAKLSDFDRAALAAAGKIGTDTLSPRQNQLLDIINRIESAQDRISRKARESLTSQRDREISQGYGGRASTRLERKFAPQLQLLNPAAQERVRAQLAQIQRLFDKGLSPEGYLRAYRAMRSGARNELRGLEEDARHRLTRINAEVARAGKGGFFDKLFGGPGGSGFINKFGGGTPVQAIAGLALARGVDNAAESIKSRAEDTANFEKQIALLKTLTQDADNVTTSFDRWQESILRVSSAVGKSKEEIASAGYDLLSNQITKGVEDTETALTKASRFATATNSTVNDSVNLLSSVINSFGKNVGDTDDILAKLFTTIDLGRIKASDLANTFGRPGVAAKSLGLSFEELGAAMITISQTGLGVEQTNTLITNVLHKLINPTEEMQKHFDDLGVSTGEMYVRQLGLVGVLEDLIKTTGGSTAELSKFFNEIRGEQGITQLTGRIDVLKDALTKLKDNKTYGGALDQFKDLSGQRFQEEMTKYNNAFIKFKEIALDALLWVTKDVGGLSNALVLATGLTTALGGAFAVLYGAHIFEKMTGSATAFATSLSAIKVIAGGLGIGIGLGIGAATLYDRHYDSTHAAERLAEQGREAAKTEADAVAQINARLTESNINQLKTYQTEALNQISKIKVGLKELAAAEKEEFSNVAAALRNDFELVSQAFKRIITQNEERERQFVESVAKHRSRLIDINDKRRANDYDAAIARNKVATGLGQQDREGRIQLGRIGELVREAHRAAKSSSPDDIERARRLYDEAQQIAQQRRTETTTTPVFTGFGTRRRRYNGGFSNVPVLKYLDGEKIAKGLANDRVKLEEEINEKAKKNLETARKQNEVDRDALKLIQDKAAKILGQKLFTPEGKLVAKDSGSALEQRDKFIKEYYDSINQLIQNARVSPEGRLALSKTFKDTREELEKQIKAWVEITNQQLITYQNQENLNKLGEKTNKDFDNQIAKAKDLKKEMDSAAAESARFRQQALKGVEALQELGPRGTIGTIGKFLGNMTDISKEGLVRGLTPEDLRNRIPKPVQDLLGETKTQINQGNPAAALALIDQGLVKLKELGAESEQVYDQTGKLVTVGEFFKQLRVSLNLFLHSEERFKSANLVADNQVFQAEKLTKMLTGLSVGYTNTKNAVAQFGIEGEKAMESLNSASAVFNANLDTMLRRLSQLTSVPDNLRNAQAAIQEGINPSLRSGQYETPGLFVGPPKPVPGDHYGGFVHHFASGGFLQDFFGGKYARGTDRNPAMLADGESVNNPIATARFAAQIIAMNAGFEPSFATTSKGGENTQYSFGDIHVHVKSGDSAAKTTREIGAAMRREIRRGSLNL